MSIFSRLNEVMWLIFFLIAKEILIAGEERVILVSYLVLFFMIFFFFNSFITTDFQYRASVIQDEIVNLFLSIIGLLTNTKNFLKTQFLLHFKAVKLYYSIFLEYYFSSYFYFNLSYFKHFYLSFMISYELSRIYDFFINLKTLLLLRFKTYFRQIYLLSTHTPSLVTFSFNFAKRGVFSLNSFSFAPESHSKKKELLPSFLVSEGAVGSVDTLPFFSVEGNLAVGATQVALGVLSSE